MNRAVVSLGSNIDPAEHVQRARDLIAASYELVAESALRMTKPVGFTEQADFLNGALLVDTALDHEAFRAFLKDVETQLGRIHAENSHGPRTIDLDIVVWNDTVVDDDFHTRAFLREAVREILPDLARFTGPLNENPLARHDPL